MQTGKISVIIPVYNRSEQVDRAIRSVLNQTLSPHEIIVVDDGSSDATMDTLKKFQNSIRILRQENQGVSKARNSGLKVATGDWIAFLDSDDEWKPEKLALQMRFHENKPDIFVSHTEDVWIRNGVRVNAGKKYQKPAGKIFSLILSSCVISPSGIIIHKKVFDKVGVFDESMPVCEDYDLWLRISREFEFGLIHDALGIKYGGHADQLSMKYPAMDIYRIHALEKHLDEHSEKKMVLQELIHKAAIISMGAKKRNNDVLFAVYHEKAEQYKKSLESLL